MKINGDGLFVGIISAIIAVAFFVFFGPDVAAWVTPVILVGLMITLGLLGGLIGRGTWLNSTLRILMMATGFIALIVGTIQWFPKTPEVVDTGAQYELNANFFPQNNLENPLSVNFDASESNASLGLKEYRWNFADGNSVTTTEPQTSHVYESSAYYPVQLTIIDNQDNEAITKHTVGAFSPGADPKEPPMARFGTSPSTFRPNTEITFDASASSDADGTIAKYEWTFGEGSNNEGKTVSHSYEQSGTYSVNLKVTDSDGLENSITQTVEVAEIPQPTSEPPTAIFTSNPDLGFAPLEIEFNASDSSDPEGGPLSYKWDFGLKDGTTNDQEVARFTYNKTGTYTVTLEVEDNTGNPAKYVSEVIISPGVPMDLETEPDQPGPEITERNHCSGVQPVCISGFAGQFINAIGLGFLGLTGKDKTVIGSIVRGVVEAKAQSKEAILELLKLAPVARWDDVKNAWLEEAQEFVDDGEISEADYEKFAEELEALFNEANEDAAIINSITREKVCSQAVDGNIVIDRFPNEPFKVWVVNCIRQNDDLEPAMINEIINEFDQLPVEN